MNKNTTFSVFKKDDNRGLQVLQYYEYGHTIVKYQMNWQKILTTVMAMRRQEMMVTYIGHCLDSTSALLDTLTADIIRHCLKIDFEN